MGFQTALVVESTVTLVPFSLLASELSFASGEKKLRYGAICSTGAITISLTSSGQNYLHYASKELGFLADNF